MWHIEKCATYEVKNMKKIKSIISIILVVIFIAGISTIFANASVNYNVDGFVLEYYNYKDCQEFMITDYNGDKTTLSTPIMYNSTYISKIAGYSFTNDSKIKSISINNYINLIGDSAFLNCSSLEEVTIDESVDTILSKAFSDCPNLSKVTIKSTDVEIANDAFSNSKKVVIYCYKGSTAETFAKTNNISYVLIDDPTEPTTEPITEPTTQPTTEPVTETVTPTEPIKTTYLLGDGNDNNHIDISDATVVQLLMAKLIEDDGRLSQRININGNCDITNATLLQMYLAKLSTIYDDAIGTTREYTK